MTNYKPFEKKREIWNHWDKTSHFIVEVIHISELTPLPKLEGWGPRFDYKGVRINLWDSYEYEWVYLTNTYRHSKLKNCKLMTHDEILDDCLKAENHLRRKYNWLVLKPYIPSFYLRERFIPQPNWNELIEKSK